MIQNGYVPPGRRVSHPRPGAVVIEVVGEHDLATRDDLLRLFCKMIDSHDLLVVDVSEASFIDSSFLNALIVTHKHGDARGSKLRLQVGTDPIVRRVLEVSDLIEYLDCVHNRDEALRN